MMTRIESSETHGSTHAWRRDWLLMIPLSMALAAAVMKFGPYAELSELARSSGGVLDESPRSSASHLAAHFESVGPRGVELYRAHFWWDAAFALSNALAPFVLMGVALTRTRPSRRVRRAALAIPLMALVADIVENLLVRQALAVQGEGSAALAGALGATTSIKMVLFGLSGFLALASIAAWALTSWRAARASRAAREPAAI